MALDLEQTLRDNDPNAFVTAVMNDPDRSAQMANVGQAIRQARESGDPALEKFAGALEGGLGHLAAAEKLELNGLDAAGAQQAGMMAGFMEIWNEMLGPDGKFQLSDLGNIDWGKVMGMLLPAVFGMEAGGGAAGGADPAAVQAEKAAAGQAFRDAQSYLRQAEAGGAGDKVRPLEQLANEQDLGEVARQIAAVAPAPG